jgi:hypothetical protein
MVRETAAGQYPYDSGRLDLQIAEGDTTRQEWDNAK